MLGSLPGLREEPHPAWLVSSRADPRRQQRFKDAASTLPLNVIPCRFHPSSVNHLSSPARPLFDYPVLAAKLLFFVWPGRT